ncbi:MAG: HAD-IA family hydrolase [Chloroflexota bacterium]|nr:HAD-IA family hydrolase [Chloroflexota bacterium]
MNDNELRGPQWRRLVGEFFPPILGGTPEAWAEANGIVAARLLDPDAWMARLQSATDYAEFDRRYNLDWLGWMCELVGVPVPPPAEAIDVARRASIYATSRVRAAYPGAAEAIRTLHSRGYRLFTASGTTSWELDGYLTAMGVRDCFERLYGPDLIATHKGGPKYYERLFADAGVTPREALVLDDNRLVLRWAASVGARTVLVGDASVTAVRPLRAIRALAELPAIIEDFE